MDQRVFDNHVIFSFLQQVFAADVRLTGARHGSVLSPAIPDTVLIYRR
jgi:hypothetical protein